MNSRDQLSDIVLLYVTTSRCHLRKPPQTMGDGPSCEQTWIPLTAKGPDTFLTERFSVHTPAAGSLARHNRARAHWGEKEIRVLHLYHDPLCMTMAE